jgi:hypothetical protein
MRMFGKETSRRSMEMYTVKRPAAGLSAVLIIAALGMTACFPSGTPGSQSRNSGSPNVFSKNRLANTTWEEVGKPEHTLTFGETSFQWKFGTHAAAGTYTFSGDTLVVDNGKSSSTGSLIGDVLVWEWKEYRQVK